jgi:hypothetical protein
MGGAADASALKSAGANVVFTRIGDLFDGLRAPRRYLFSVHRAIPFLKSGMPNNQSGRFRSAFVDLAWILEGVRIHVV